MISCQRVIIFIYLCTYSQSLIEIKLLRNINSECFSKLNKTKRQIKPCKNVLSIYQPHFSPQNSAKNRFPTKTTRWMGWLLTHQRKPKNHHTDANKNHCEKDNKIISSHWPCGPSTVRETFFWKNKGAAMPLIRNRKVAVRR